MRASCLAVLAVGRREALQNVISWTVAAPAVTALLRSRLDSGHAAGVFSWMLAGGTLVQPCVGEVRLSETMTIWKRDLDDSRAVAITDEGDRLTTQLMAPQRCWWAVRLWDSSGSGPDREGFERSVEDARRVAEAMHRELRARRPGKAPPGRRLR
jgi:hypothetical protein